MGKIRVNMLSIADSVDGQGVGSAYKELVQLIEEEGKNDFELQLNKNIKNCDIIHIHTIELRNYFKMKFSKKPTIAYVHFLPDTMNGSIKLPKPIFYIFKKYIVRFYKNADYLVVVNPTFKKEMIKIGLDENKITYIPNYVSKDNFYKEEHAQIEKVRNQYSLNQNDFVVLGCGQVQTRKGVVDFIEVAKKLPQIKFIWAGGFSFGKITDGHKELKKVMENHPDNVQFLDIVPREKMNDLFNAVDLLFVPSYNELFPMTILEAMSTETPILLRNLELYEEILFKRYLCATNNNDFANMIQKLKEDKNLYTEQIDNAKFISNYYSKERIYNIWKEYYNKVLTN